jgi:16S rRNA (adenine1518-N6/adenine1519-N6)-dimethyltransferase
MEKSKAGFMNDYPDFKRIRAAIMERDFRFTRRWGQNFLTERKLLRTIVAAAEAGEGDLILEIGTGPGCLTFPLLESGATVVGVEIDKKLVEIGMSLLAHDAPQEAKERMVWIEGDFLSKKDRIHPDIESVIRDFLDQAPELKLKVVANLPYCIATPAIVNILESDLPCQVMVVTIQQEVADRLTARPGTSAYGSLTVLTQALAERQVLRSVNPACFWPKPKVGSSILKLIPKKDRFPDKGLTYKTFKDFTRRIFSYKRKTWLKSLKTSFKSINIDMFAVELESQGIRSDVRAEAIDVEEIMNLARLFSKVADSADIDLEDHGEKT